MSHSKFVIPPYFERMSKTATFAPLLMYCVWPVVFLSGYHADTPIGTCPYFEVKLKLNDDKPFFIRPYNIREDQKPIIQKEMDRLEKFGIIHKGLIGYSSPVLLVKRKQQNLYRVVTDFRVLNERLV